MKDIGVEIQQLVKRFGDVLAVDHIDLEMFNAELLVILGPSGCGKTTLLRLLAGFEIPDAGVITVKGSVVSNSTGVVRPEYRNMGMVFQQLVLWPNMNVWNNIAYPLKVKGLSQSEIRKDVNEILEVVGLSGLERRRPDQLSGGQQQRVALARALCLRPKLLLMDEPLSSLDAKIRMELPMEIHRIQRQIGITTLYVTHDQKEALSIADRIAIMKDGRIVQIDSGENLYHNPNSTFVAHFLGETNFLTGRLKKIEKDGRCQVLLGQDNVAINGRFPREMVLSIEKPVYVLIRPEDIEITGSDHTDISACSLLCIIKESIFQGAFYTVTVYCPSIDKKLRMNYPSKLGNLKSGEKVNIIFPETGVKVFPKESKDVEFSNDN